MAFIDPWSGVESSVKSLSDASSMYRQQQRDEMARQDWEFAKAERERKLADEMAVRDVENKLRVGKQVTTRTETPEATAYLNQRQPLTLEQAVADNEDYTPSGLAMLRQGAGLSDEGALASQPLPQPGVMFDEQTTTKPYSPIEQARMRHDVLASQGKYKEAGLAQKDTLDVTTQIPAHINKLSQTFLAAAQPLLARGVDPATVKQAVLDNFRKMGVDEESLDTMDDADLLPNGYSQVRLPDGSTLTGMLQPDGTIKQEHKAVVKPQTGKYPGMPVIETVAGKKMKGQYVFSTAEERDAYEKTGVPRGGNWESNFGDKSTTVVVTGAGRNDRALTMGEIQGLEERRKPLEIMTTLRNTYDPSFRPVGATVTTSDTIGSLQNKIMKSVGNNPQASAWWQDYFQWANTELKKQSGAAVTPNEMERFLKANISESSNPSVVTNWMDRTIQRNADDYERVASALGVKKQSGVDAYQRPTKNVVTKGPKVGDVVKGYKFLGGDPANKASWRKQ